MKLREFVATLGDETCRRIHEEYCEFEAKGKIGDGALRSTTGYYIKHFAVNPDGQAIVMWMDQIAKEVWRRYAVERLESKT